MASAKTGDVMFCGLRKFTLAASLVGLGLVLGEWKLNRG